MVSEKGGRDADGESLQALTRRVLLSHAAAGAAAGLFVSFSFFFCNFFIMGCLNLLNFEVI